MSFYNAVVSDIMITDVMTANPQLTVLEALTLMIKNGVDQLPVTEGNRLVGMINWWIISQKVILKKMNPSKILVEDVMNRKPKKIVKTESAVSALKTVIRIRAALPVVSKNKLIGLFTFHDALDYYLKTFRGQTSRENF